MQKPPESRTILRWAFLVLGMFLIVRPDIPLNVVLSLRSLTAFLFANNRRLQDLALIPAMLILMQSGVLSLITAWGLHRGRRWARWTGLFTCLSLLPGFPWFTLIGVVGLLVLLTVPIKVEGTSSQATTNQTKDYWSAARDSRMQKVITFISGALIIAGVDGSWWLARRVGLPESTMRWEWWIWLFVLSLANIAIHELGHAFAAWTMHHRIRAISIGPLTFSKTHHGYSFRIQWSQLLELRGYTSSVPTFREHVRLQQVFVVAAGPLASLTTGVLALATFLSLQGTRWEGYWEFAALYGVIAFTTTLASLSPFGYTDGSMLMHLIMWTPPGQMLVDNNIAAHMHDEAILCFEEADFIKQVSLCEQLLEHTQKWGESNSATIAIAQQQLGSARAALGDWTLAETAFRECLHFETECAANLALAANAWALLHSVCVHRMNVPEAERVYPQALAILELRKKNRTGSGVAVTSAMLAELHQRAGQVREGLHEAGIGLSHLPFSRQHYSLRAVLLAAKAYCEIRTGSVDSGLSSAAAAAEIVRSGKIPDSSQNLAWSRIGELGVNLVRAGHPERGIELLLETISRLELGGAHTTAKRHRIKTAQILRHLTRYDEAEKTLTEGADSLPACLVRALLREQAELKLITGRFEEAAHNCQRLVSLWHAEPNASTEVASAESIYATACLEACDYDRAKFLANQALGLLTEWQHPDALRCQVTLALVNWRSDSNSIVAPLSEAKTQIERTNLLTPIEKAQFLDEEANRLKKHSRPSEAEDFRRSSTAQLHPIAETQVSASLAYM